MARGNKKIEGQICFDMCLDGSNYVVQANSLLGGRQALSLNCAKIIRATIMQIVREDVELKPYVITIGELAKLLNVSKTNLYRDIEDMANEVMESRVEIRTGFGENAGWKKLNWVSFTEYQPDAGLAIKLNGDLKPYLLNLKERYTQYTLDNILAMKSVYAIRIFEILQEKMLVHDVPEGGLDIEISVQYIRECCDCEDKYEKFSHFKSRVLDSAVNEINRVTKYMIDYEYVKKGKSVQGILFHINTKKDVVNESGEQEKSIERKSKESVKKVKGMTKSAERYNDYPQRQHSAEYLAELEEKLLNIPN